jgi:fibronectin-binding autotransporter adhesin
MVHRPPRTESGTSVTSPVMRSAFAAVAAAGFLFTSSASAATYSWTNGSGNRTWDTSLLNWTLGSGNVAWVASNDAVFGSTGAGTVTVSGSQSVTSLAITGTGFTLSGGTIGLASATTSFTATQSGTISSVLAGESSLLSNGTATLVLTGSNTFTGSTLVNAGTLRIAGPTGRLGATTAVSVSGGTLINGDATAATNNGISNRINSSASLTLGGSAGGGTYTQVAPAASNTHSQSFTGLALGPGVNVISPSGATGTNSLTFTGAAASAYTRSPGGTLNIIPQAGASIAFSNLPSTAAGSGADAILPGAAINGNDFVGFSGSGPYTTGTATYFDTSTTTWTAGKNMNVTGSVTPGVATNVNSIRFNSATPYTVTLTGSNVIGSGNILVTAAATTASSATITGGTITSAAMSGTVAELTIFDRRGVDMRSGVQFVIGSALVDNGSTPLAVTVAGKADGTSGQFNNNTGLVSLAGANTFSGGLSLVSGGVIVAGDSALGTAPATPTTNVRVSGISALRVTTTGTLNANRTIELNNGYLTVYPTTTGTLTIPGQIIGTGTLTNYTNLTQGVLVLSGSNTFSGRLSIGSNNIRADDGVGLPQTANLQLISQNYSSSMLQTSGTFTRAIGTAPGQVSWAVSGGGFATNGAPLTVALGGTGSLNTFQWGTSSVSETSGIVLAGDAGLTWLNPIDLTTATSATRTLSASSGTSELRGVISGNSGASLAFVGTGAFLVTGANSYAGKTSITQGTVAVTSLNSVVGGSATSSLGAPTTEGNGTIDLSVSTYQGTLRYIGTGETTDRKLNIPVNTAGYGANLDQSGSGLLRFTSNFAATGFGSGKIFTLQGSTSGQGEFSGSIADNVSGTTTLKTAFASGTTTIALDSVTSIVAGAAVSGSGIAPGTTVSSVNTATRVVTLSQATTGAATVGTLISVAGVTNPLIIKKDGTGIWTLSGSNSYTGGTTLSAGILTFMTPNAQPSSGTVGVSAGASIGLGVGGADSFTSANVDAAFANTLTRVILNASSNVALDTTAGNFSYASNITSRSLTKLSANTLTLSGSNTTSGTMTAVAGTLQFAKTASLFGGTAANWTASRIVSGSGATLAFNVGGSGEFTQGNVTTLLTNLASSTSAANGMNAGANLGFDTTNASSGTFTINDAIANTTGASGGARGLVKLGSGTLVLGGSNSFSGGSTVSGGSLRLGHASGLGSPSGRLAIQAGSVDLNGNSVTIGLLTGSAGTSITSGVVGAARLTSSSADASTFAGTIGDGSGSVGFTKAGAGRLTFTAAQSYTGSTIISGGTLALGAGSALASSLLKAGDVTGDGGTLDVTALAAGLQLQSGQKLGGHGTVLGNTVIGSGATVAPGGSIGLLVNSGTQTWLGGGSFDFDIANATGVAGSTGWDLLDVNTLLISATTTSPFVINVIGLTNPADNTSGPLLAGNWNPDASYQWKFVTAANAITSFDASWFTVNQSLFGNNNAVNGGFAVVRGDSVAGGTTSELYITYAAVPEPATIVLALIGAATAVGVARRRRHESSAEDSP